MDEYNRGKVWWINTPDDVKQKIRKAKHVQWYDNTRWRNFTGARERQGIIAICDHLAYRVVREPKARPSVSRQLSLLRAYVKQTAVASSGNPLVAPKWLTFTPAQRATFNKMKGV